MKLLASPKFSQFPGATQGQGGAGRMCGRTPHHAVVPASLDVRFQLSGVP